MVNISGAAEVAIEVGNMAGDPSAVAAACAELGEAPFEPIKKCAGSTVPVLGKRSDHAVRKGTDNNEPEGLCEP